MFKVEPPADTRWGAGCKLKARKYHN